MDFIGTVSHVHIMDTDLNLATNMLVNTPQHPLEALTMAFRSEEMLLITETILLFTPVFKELFGMDRLVFILVLTSMLVLMDTIGMELPANIMDQAGIIIQPFVSTVNYGMDTLVSAQTTISMDQDSPSAFAHQVITLTDTTVSLLLHLLALDHKLGTV